MDDETDLTPALRQLDPDERELVEELRGALEDRPARREVLRDVEHRAAVRHRRRLAGGAGVVALAMAGVLALAVQGPPPLGGGAPVASGGTEAEVQDGVPARTEEAVPAPPAPTDDAPLDPTLVAPGPAGGPWLLSPSLVGFFIPNSVVVEEPAPVAAAQDPSGALLGGFCGDAALTGVSAPTSAWAGAWEQDGLGAGDRDTTSLREAALLWDDATPGAEPAVAYVEALRTSATECRDASGTVSYRIITGLETAGQLDVIAVAPVADSETTWRVRAAGAGAGPDGRTDTVVDLDLVILAATAEDAAWIADGVITITLSTASTDPTVMPGSDGTAP